jgi:hypothetical protein
MGGAIRHLALVGSAVDMAEEHSTKAAEVHSRPHIKTAESGSL